MNMKIAVHLVIEVDTEAWELTYGTSKIASDVRAYVYSQIAESAAAEERAITRVEFLQRRPVRKP